MFDAGEALVAGAVATIALTTILEGSVALGQSRLSIPYLLGTLFTPDRRRAQFLGFVVHGVNGLGFALLYAAAFSTLGSAAWWAGALLGLAHAGLVLSIVSSIPAVHPRMATEQDGPEAVRALQPPGFLALHYGVRTPVVTILAHVLYGALMGALYHAG